MSVSTRFEPEDPSVDDIELLITFDKKYDPGERINKLREVWKLNCKIRKKYDLSRNDIDILIDENRWNEGHEIEL